MMEREFVICRSLCETRRSEKGCRTRRKNGDKRITTVVLERGLVPGRGDQGPALLHPRLC